MFTNRYDLPCLNFMSESGGAGGGGEGGSGGAGDGGQGGQGGESGSSYTPPADQAALDKIIEDRLIRERRRYADYDQLKDTAGKYQALLATTQTDQERAIAEAKKPALDEAAAANGPRLVKQAFKAEAKGVLTAEQLNDLLEDRDLSKFLKDGEPDDDKIAALVARFAPKGDDGKQPFPDLGGGNRGGTPKTTNMNDLIRRGAGVVT